MRPLFMLVLVAAIRAGGGYFSWQEDMPPASEAMGQQSDDVATSPSTQLRAQEQRLTDRFSGTDGGDAAPER